MTRRTNSLSTKLQGPNPWHQCMFFFKSPSSVHRSQNRIWPQMTNVLSPFGHLPYPRFLPSRQLQLTLLWDCLWVGHGFIISFSAIDRLGLGGGIGWDEGVRSLMGKHMEECGNALRFNHRWPPPMVLTGLADLLTMLAHCTDPQTPPPLPRESTPPHPPCKTLISQEAILELKVTNGELQGLLRDWKKWI